MSARSSSPAPPATSAASWSRRSPRTRGALDAHRRHRRARRPAARPPGPASIYETPTSARPGWASSCARHRIDAVVHLASIVTPGQGRTREFAVRRSTCWAPRTCSRPASRAGVGKIVVTSSGAAYGYHADNAAAARRGRAAARQPRSSPTPAQAPGRGAARPLPRRASGARRRSSSGSAPSSARPCATRSPTSSTSG